MYYCPCSFNSFEFKHNKSDSSTSFEGEAQEAMLSRFVYREAGGSLLCNLLLELSCRPPLQKHQTEER